MNMIKFALTTLRCRLHNLSFFDSDGENIGLVSTDLHQAYKSDIPNGHSVKGSASCNGEGIGGPSCDEANAEPPGSDSTDGYSNSNVWQAGWNVGNCMQGIGLLSLPYTVKEGGLAALLTMAVVLIIGSYTSKILVYCMYEEDDDEQGQNLPSRRRVRNNYSEVADSCFVWGRQVMNILQLIDMVAVATLYLELAGNLLEDTFYFLGWGELVWTILCVGILLPTVFFKNLTNISWLSLVAIVSLGLMFGSIGWYSFGKSVQWDIKSLPKFEINSFFLSASIILFNFGCQFLVPGVEKSMKNPSKFNAMVNCTYFITGILTLTYSISAFLTFEDNTQEFITYNMPRGILQAAVSLLFAIKSLLSYPLMMFLIVNTIDDLNLKFLPSCFAPNTSYLPSFWAVVFRSLLVLFTLLLAVIVPHFALLMGLTGSLTAPWLDFIFPCLFYLKLKGHTLKWYSKGFNWFIIVIGVIGGAIGLIYSTIAMVNAISNDLQGKF